MVKLNQLVRCISFGSLVPVEVPEVLVWSVRIASLRPAVPEKVPEVLLASDWSSSTASSMVDRIFG